MKKLTEIYANSNILNNKNKNIYQEFINNNNIIFQPHYKFEGSNLLINKKKLVEQDIHRQYYYIIKTENNKYKMINFFDDKLNNIITEKFPQGEIIKYGINKINRYELLSQNLKEFDINYTEYINYLHQNIHNTSFQFFISYFFATNIIESKITTSRYFLFYKENNCTQIKFIYTMQTEINSTKINIEEELQLNLEKKRVISNRLNISYTDHNNKNDNSSLKNKINILQAYYKELRKYQNNLPENNIVDIVSQSTIIDESLNKFKNEDGSDDLILSALS